MLRAGQTATQVLVAGCQRMLRTILMLRLPRLGKEPGGRPTWQFEIRLVSASRAGVRLRVRWTRTADNPGGSEARRENTRDIQLRQAEHHVLDFVENSPEAPAPRARLLVRVSAEPRVEPIAFQATTVDLWLVEEQDGRPVRSVSEQMAGRVGFSAHQE
jgi:hypothetical protein